MKLCPITTSHSTREETLSPSHVYTYCEQCQDDIAYIAKTKGLIWSELNNSWTRNPEAAPEKAKLEDEPKETEPLTTVVSFKSREPHHTNETSTEEYKDIRRILEAKGHLGELSLSQKSLKAVFRSNGKMIGFAYITPLLNGFSIDRLQMKTHPLWFFGKKYDLAEIYTGTIKIRSRVTAETIHIEQVHCGRLDKEEYSFKFPMSLFAEPF